MMTYKETNIPGVWMLEPQAFKETCASLWREAEYHFIYENR